MVFYGFASCFSLAMRCCCITAWFIVRGGILLLLMEVKFVTHSGLGQNRVWPVITLLYWCRRLVIPLRCDRPCPDRHILVPLVIRVWTTMDLTFRSAVSRLPGLNTHFRGYTGHVSLRCCLSKVLQLLKHVIHGCFVSVNSQLSTNGKCWK